MVLPSPELLRRFKNTESIVKSGRSYLIPESVTKYPNDYVDMATYESIKKAIELNSDLAKADHLIKEKKIIDTMPIMNNDIISDMTYGTYPYGSSDYGGTAPEVPTPTPTPSVAGIFMLAGLALTIILLSRRKKG